jgi:uncharacterized protein (TIGR03437 family)
MFTKLITSMCIGIITGLSQSPVINDGGVGNAASYATITGPGHALARGSIATIFGKGLSLTPVVAQSSPLPTTLNGTTVNIGGFSAPLLYVSPDQVNFQVPVETPVSRVPVTVSTAAGTSAPALVDIAQTGVGIFSANGSGCGGAAALNVAEDGSMSVNSPTNSASPGQFVALFGTGLGLPLGPSQIADGTPGPWPPALAPYGVGFAVDQVIPGKDVLDRKAIAINTTFAGKAPGLVGVDQINAQLPSDVREGCAVPIQIATYFGEAAASQAVTISIRRGGGQCVDPPTSSTGALTLKRLFVLNDSPVTESVVFEAWFPGAPGLISSVWPDPAAGSRWFPHCVIPGYSALDAGVIGITAPDKRAVQVLSTKIPDGVSYDTTLPAAFQADGTYTITAVGGAGVGSFQVPIIASPGIQVLSQFPRGSNVQTISSSADPLTVKWAGGQPGQTVTVQLIEHFSGADVAALSRTVAANIGAISFERVYSGSGWSLGIGVADHVDIVIEVDTPAQVQPFTATGLNLGGLARMIYEYRFTGLTAYAQ